MHYFRDEVFAMESALGIIHKDCADAPARSTGESFSNLSGENPMSSMVVEPIKVCGPLYGCRTLGFLTPEVVHAESWSN